MLDLMVTSGWLKPKPATLTKLSSLNGMAFIVASILLVVLFPLCVIALIVGVVGFLYFPFSAVCLFYVSVAAGPFITAGLMRDRLTAMTPDKKRKGWRLSTCAAVVLSCVLVAIFPVLLTQRCGEAMMDKAMVPQSLLLLRGAGDENALLQACYSEKAHLPWFFQLPGELLSSSNRFYSEGSSGKVMEEMAREVYYRVKGRPFNTAPRTKLSFLGAAGPFGGDENYDWDDDYYYFLDYNDHDFAGETVGGVVRGLSLTDSKMNGWVDANEAVAHLQWNMKFKVESGKGKEIRAQIMLPPNAVVTGCSLWINGRKLNSFITTRESSRTAYVQSAQRGERPLLVSTAGAGRVLIQSSTGYWGDGASLVLDMTSPLVIIQPDKAALPLPVFTERNFSISVPHQVSIISATKPLSTNLAAMPVGKNGGSEVLVQGSIKNTDMSSVLGTLSLSRNEQFKEIAAADPCDWKKCLVQTIKSFKMSADAPTTFVIDGSASMADYMSTICDALQDARSNDASILWASDSPLTVVSHVRTDSSDWTNAVRKLRDSASVGGQNNAEALSTAVTELTEYKAAKRKGQTNIVWLHAGQPVKFTGEHLLSQLKNNSSNITLYEYQVEPGPNEVVNSLDQISNLVQIPRIATLRQDLKSLTETLSGQATGFTIQREPVPTGSSSAPLARHAAEITQLYASNIVSENLQDPAKRKRSEELAEGYKIVTPLTSALVLEFDNRCDSVVETQSTAKKPSNQSVTSGFAGVIPARPEPPLSLIMLCALAILGFYLCLTRQRKQIV